jgi:hypothetical protein
LAGARLLCRLGSPSSSETAPAAQIVLSITRRPNLQFAAALAVSSAILLILEMYSPYVGLLHISSATLRAAIAQLGR